MVKVEVLGYKLPAGGIFGIGSIAALIILIIIVAVTGTIADALTAALIGLIGTVGVAILNWAVFEPSRDREEHDNLKENLRNALYSEMAFIYQSLKTVLDAYKDEDVDKNMPVDYDGMKTWATFDVYSTARANNLLLFYELQDALAIDTFYRMMMGDVQDPGVEITAEDFVSIVEADLADLVYAISIREINISVPLLEKSCGRLRLFKRCIQELDTQVKAYRSLDKVELQKQIEKLDQLDQKRRSIQVKINKKVADAKSKKAEGSQVAVNNRPQYPLQSNTSPAIPGRGPARRMIKSNFNVCY